MKDNKIRTLPNSVPDVIVPNIPGAMFRRACDADWTMQFISDPIENITGYPAWEFINNSNRSLGGLIHPDDKEMVETAIHNALLAKRPYNIAYRLLYRDGSIRWVNENGQGFSENGQLSYIDGVIVNITGQKVFQGITERKKTELYLNLLVDVLAILKDSIDFKDLAQRLLSAIKQTTGCDAVGMRLQAGEDYPYFLQEGFPNDFLLTENTLIERNPNDSLVRNPDGSVRLKCTCGLIISGKTDPSSPWFTRSGSFWTNNSAPLLALPDPDDPWRNPRNNCI
ncbi:MAG TPA: PAS domain-containing protein, partial [Bacillota bacterium]|nr:PAS domain-containing protein [Bacillota bacterium]